MEVLRIDVIALVILLTSLPSAQVQWRKLADGPPPGRTIGDMCYDSNKEVVLLCGGRSGSTGTLYDTWEWNGWQWTQRRSIGISPLISYSDMVFDEIRARAVLLGVLASSAETWEWDGSSWIRRSVNSYPNAIADFSMVFDAARGSTLLFGGIDSGFAAMSETWVWDGTTWRMLRPRTLPSARYRPVLAYDRGKHRVLLTGGYSASNSWQDDLWEWSGSDWNRIMASGVPFVRHMIHDEGRDVIVGLLDCCSPNGFETWEYDRIRWLPRTVPRTPPLRYGVCDIVYDASRREAVCFGGGGVFPVVDLADTWAYAPVNPADYTLFGLGCAGTAGTPFLQPTPAQALPWLGDLFELEVSPVPSNAAVAFNLGFSKTQWGPLPLPFPLGGIGMIGCTLFSSGDISSNGSAFGNRATVGLPLPLSPTNVGLVFYNQAFVLDPGANPLGVVASNGGAGLTGSR